MSGFVLEALFIGLKEGAKLALCSFLLCSFFRSRGLDALKRPMTAAFAVVFLASFAVMRFPVTLELRDVIVRMTGYVFGVFYLLSLGALFHATGTDLLGPLARLFEKKSVLAPLAFILTVAYFTPDMAGSSLYVADLFSMAGRTLPVFVAAAAGFGVTLVPAYLLARRSTADVSGLFGFPQLILFLALVKLVAGGVRGFAGFSLIPSVQAGIMKLIHDVVHQTFVLALVPDHMILTTTAWQFIGVLFGSDAGLWLSLVVILLPLAVFVRKHFAEKIEVPAEIAAPARRRIFVKAMRDQRVLKSLPVLAFMVFIVALWFGERGESAGRLYLPDPRPLAAEGGLVKVPLETPADDLRDGAIHKYTVPVNGEQARLLIMKKPDGTLAVCLDACEICPPEGYGQAKEHVICVYCNTPIPFDTVGKPGGCNPIPLKALVTDKDVQLELAEIAEQWAAVKTGATKERVER